MFAGYQIPRKIILARFKERQGRRLRKKVLLSAAGRNGRTANKAELLGRLPGDTTSFTQTAQKRDTITAARLQVFCEWRRSLPKVPATSPERP